MVASPSRKRSRRSTLWNDLPSRRAPPATLNSYDPMKRIALVREGVPAAMLPFLADEMATSRDWLYRIIGVPPDEWEARSILEPDSNAGWDAEPAGIGMVSLDCDTAWQAGGVRSSPRCRAS